MIEEQYTEKMLILSSGVTGIQDENDGFAMHFHINDNWLR